MVNDSSGSILFLLLGNEIVSNFLLLGNEVVSNDI